jgi:hypothetical protein
MSTFVGGEQLTQAVALARLCRLGDAEHQLARARAELRRVERGQHDDGLHQRLGGAAGFRDGDEARGRQWRRASSRPNVSTILIRADQVTSSAASPSGPSRCPAPAP